MGQDESVRIQGTVPKWIYNEVQNKAPVSAEAGDVQLIRHVFEEWLRDRNLEEMRATDRRPDQSYQDRSNLDSKTDSRA